MSIPEADSGSRLETPLRTIPPEELGSSVAHLVWESFLDLLERDRAIPSAQVPVVEEDPEQEGALAEELLIFVMWVHTRAIQLAFRKGEIAGLVLRVLDSMHRVIFEDLRRQGTPSAHLPIFEQRVGARYAEYGTAASRSAAAVGDQARQHVHGPRSGTESAQALTAQAVLLARPLQDFLSEVRLDPVPLPA